MREQHADKAPAFENWHAEAIASQTSRDVTERDAVDAFTGRLQALSSAHDILLQQHWSSARMVDVVTKVLYLHVPQPHLKITGPDILLGPKAGLSLSLLLHELATNAQKYGSLSNDVGSIIVEWSVGDVSGVSQLSLTWRESGGPAVVEPTSKGFGSRLIRMGLAGSGHSEKRYETTGLVAHFLAPMSLVREKLS